MNRVNNQWYRHIFVIFNRSLSRQSTENIRLLFCLMIGASCFLCNTSEAGSNSTNIISEKTKYNPDVLRRMPPSAGHLRALFNLESERASSMRMRKDVLDISRLWKMRDTVALRLIHAWEKNPQELDDPLTVATYGQQEYYRLVRSIKRDKEQIQERLRNPEVYDASYEYRSYFQRPETMVLTNTHACMKFATSQDESLRARIVPIIGEINDSDSLSVLANMAAGDKSKRVRDKAGMIWLIMSMPEELINHQQILHRAKSHIALFKEYEIDQKIWLNAFVESEKKLGDEGKMWAIEAAERMLRKMERKRTEPPS